MNCIAAPSIQNQFSPHDCVATSLKDVVTPTVPKYSGGISISFGGIKLSISR
jgi:hypothetical protein